MQPLPTGRSEILVSVPERALLELLSDVGKTQSLSEARQLVETMSTLRAKTLDELLAHTTRIKVVRLAEQMANDLNLPWAPLAKRHSQRLGGGKTFVVKSEHVELDHLVGIGPRGARIDSPFAHQQHEIAIGPILSSHITRMDDEHPFHAQGDLCHLIKVRVIHVRAMVPQREFIKKCLAGWDWLLCQTGDAVHAVGD